MQYFRSPECMQYDNRGPRIHCIQKNDPQRIARYAYEKHRVQSPCSDSDPGTIKKCRGRTNWTGRNRTDIQRIAGNVCTKPRLQCLTPLQKLQKNCLIDYIYLYSSFLKFTINHFFSQLFPSTFLSLNHIQLIFGVLMNIIDWK